MDYPEDGEYKKTRIDDPDDGEYTRQEWMIRMTGSIQDKNR